MRVDEFSSDQRLEFARLAFFKKHRARVTEFVATYFKATERGGLSQMLAGKELAYKRLLPEGSLARQEYEKIAPGEIAVWRYWQEDPDLAMTWNRKREQGGCDDQLPVVTLVMWFELFLQPPGSSELSSTEAHWLDELIQEEVARLAPRDLHFLDYSRAQLMEVSAFICDPLARMDTSTRRREAAGSRYAAYARQLDGWTAAVAEAEGEFSSLQQAIHLDEKLAKFIADHEGELPSRSELSAFSSRKVLAQAIEGLLTGPRMQAFDSSVYGEWDNDVDEALQQLQLQAADLRRRGEKDVASALEMQLADIQGVLADFQQERKTILKQLLIADMKKKFQLGAESNLNLAQEFQRANLYSCHKKMSQAMAVFMDPAVVQLHKQLASLPGQGEGATSRQALQRLRLGRQLTGLVGRYATPERLARAECLVDYANQPRGFKLKRSFVRLAQVISIVGIVSGINRLRRGESFWWRADTRTQQRSTTLNRHCMRLFSPRHAFEVSMPDQAQALSKARGAYLLSSPRASRT
jgi:hypothetical protein